MSIIAHSNHLPPPPPHKIKPHSEVRKRFQDLVGLSLQEAPEGSVARELCLEAFVLLWSRVRVYIYKVGGGGLMVRSVACLSPAVGGAFTAKTPRTRTNGTGRGGVPTGGGGGGLPLRRARGRSGGGAGSPRPSRAAPGEMRRPSSFSQTCFVYVLRCLGFGTSVLMYGRRRVLGGTGAPRVQCPPRLPTNTTILIAIPSLCPNHSPPPASRASKASSAPSAPAPPTSAPCRLASWSNQQRPWGPWGRRRRRRSGRRGSR